MKFINSKKVLLSSGAFFISTSLCLLLSCSKEKSQDFLSNISLKATSGTATFTDKDVFKGVMFVNGIVADTKLADFDDFRPESLTSDTTKWTEANNFINTVVDSIDTANPGYLTSFRSKIGSGNIDTIKAAMGDAYHKIYNISLRLNGQTDASVKSAGNTFAHDFSNRYGINKNSSESSMIKAIQQQALVICSAIVTNPSPTLDVNLNFEYSSVIVINGDGGIAIVCYSPYSFFNSYINDSYIATITSDFVGI